MNHPLGTSFVGRIDGGPVNGPGSKYTLVFPSQDVAEDWIAAREKTDPEGVERGDYYVDVVTEDSL